MLLMGRPAKDRRQTMLSGAGAGHIPEGGSKNPEGDRGKQGGLVRGL